MVLKTIAKLKFTETNDINTKLTKSEAKNLLDKAIFNYVPSGDSELFRKLANGLFQSEGTISARIRNKSISPIVTLVQNLNEESLKFFVKLWYELNKCGSLSISESQSGSLVIRLSTESWKDSLISYANYFDSGYGEKYISWQKLKTIRVLMKLKDNSSRVELVKIIYSLAASGNKRLLSLQDQLSLLNLTFDGNFNLVSTFKDNSTVPSFPFILGFILGDGSLSIRIRLVHSSLWLIPVLQFPQKSLNSNIQFFEALNSYLKTLNITTSLVKNTSNMTILNIEGNSNILVLLPLFKRYIHMGFWKKERIKLLMYYMHYITNGIHLTRQGLIFILHTIYSYSHNRKYSLEHWINLANVQFNNVDIGCKSKNHCIQPYNGRGEKAGIQIGWRVVLPTNFSSKAPLKYFSFSKFGCNQVALCEAIKYRDSIIESHINNIKSSYTD